jgi:hypothetical protein
VRPLYCTNGPPRNECRQPAAPGRNPLGLCPEHLAIYEKHMHPSDALEEAKRGRSGLSVLPLHAPCGVALGEPYGDGMGLRCAIVRTFRLVGLGAKGAKFYEHVDAPGCGRVFELCALHGQRACPCGGSA